MALLELLRSYKGEHMDNNDNFATEILKEVKAVNKRLFIALIIVIVLWFGTIGGFLWYNSLPVDTGTEASISQDSEDNGTNNYVGGDYNGEANDKNKDVQP